MFILSKLVQSKYCTFHNDYKTFYSLNFYVDVLEHETLNIQRTYDVLQSIQVLFFNIH